MLSKEERDALVMGHELLAWSVVNRFAKFARRRGIDINDLSTDVLNAINDGKMLFAIDQAQYLQGYLAIVYMTQFLKTGAVAPGSAEGVTLTGPQFVTKDNAADVIKFTQEGVR